MCLLSRRNFLGTAAAALPISAVAAAAPDAPAKTASPGSYVDSARETARWIRSAARKTDEGVLWLPDPDHPEKTATITAPASLYTGNAGTVLFFLQLAKATGDASYLDDAKSGADYVRGNWRGVPEFPFVATHKKFNLDFNHGLSGTAFSLAQVWQATGDPTYRTAALTVTQYIVDAARPIGDGVDWIGAPGAAMGDGAIVLYLLWAAHAFEDPAYLQLAVRAGKRFLQLSEKPADGGLKWNGFRSEWFGIKQEIYMPNFEFGTAGVAYVLARLYEETKDASFLDAAKAGIQHVQNISTVSGDSALLFLSDPGGKELYYLGYCGGPVGTARAFYQLYRVTKEPEYLQWTERFARGVMTSGVPEKQTPGLWNVVCQCCGTAGIIDMFTSLWLATKRQEYLAYAQRVADQTLSRATNLDGKGLRWYQAWTRTKPWEVAAETGYMVGAAGVATALLHVQLANENRYQAILFPDNPYPRS